MVGFIIKIYYHIFIIYNVSEYEIFNVRIFYEDAFKFCKKYCF